MSRELISCYICNREEGTRIVDYDSIRVYVCRSCYEVLEHRFLLLMAELSEGRNPQEYFGDNKDTDSPECNNNS